MACLVDDTRRVLKQDFAAYHADSRSHMAIAEQFFGPCGFGDGIVVQEGDPFSPGASERQIVGMAEAGVVRQEEGLRVGKSFRPDTQALAAAVNGTIVHQHEFPSRPGLLCERGKTFVEKW